MQMNIKFKDVGMSSVPFSIQTQPPSCNDNRYKRHSCIICIHFLFMFFLILFVFFLSSHFSAKSLNIQSGNRLNLFKNAKYCFCLMLSENSYQRVMMATVFVSTKITRTIYNECVFFIF
ncbi:hypothetical protein FKM82_001547 [Ascaphus truei]